MLAIVTSHVRLSSTAQSLSNANRLVSRADKRVIAYYYNYRCAYINQAAAIGSRSHVCAPCVCTPPRAHRRTAQLDRRGIGAAGAPRPAARARRPPPPRAASSAPAAPPASLNNKTRSMAGVLLPI